MQKPLKRGDMLKFFARQPSALIGMEAYGSAHYRARELRKLGHDARLMPPAYVKPYLKRGKNDARDAEAICETVGRPTMGFVPVRSVEQQCDLAIHNVRNLLNRQRTQLCTWPALRSRSHGGQWRWRDGDAASQGGGLGG